MLTLKRLWVWIFVCCFKNLSGSGVKKARFERETRREWKEKKKKTKAPLDERESEWKWKGSDFPQLYFILRISSRTVGCLSVAGELVTLCTVHNMKLAKLTLKLSAVNAGRFACRGFQVSFSGVGGGARGREEGGRKKRRKEKKELGRRND